MNDLEFNQQINTSPKKFYWFGDSWIVGSELELTLASNQRPSDYTFAKHVSKHFNAEYVNLGDPGSGPDILPYHFSKIADKITKDDVIFFCLSASHRTAIFNDDRTPYQIIPGPNYNKFIHPYVKEWYKFFDTKQQRIYTYDKTIMLLYLWIASLGATVYFCNTFTTEPITMINNIVPDLAWLVPRNKCLAHFILHTIDNNGGIVVGDDMPFLKNNEWAKQKLLVDKYIKPGFCHPNILGHQEIANQLIKILETPQ